MFRSICKRPQVPEKCHFCIISIIKRQNMPKIETFWLWSYFSWVWLIESIQYRILRPPPGVDTDQCRPKTVLRPTNADRKMSSGRPMPTENCPRPTNADQRRPIIDYRPTILIYFLFFEKADQCRPMPTTNSPRPTNADHCRPIINGRLESASNPGGGAS